MKSVYVARPETSSKMGRSAFFSSAASMAAWAASRDSRWRWVSSAVGGAGGSAGSAAAATGLF
jgi:hypothetical protein